MVEQRFIEREILGGGGERVLEQKHSGSCEKGEEEPPHGLAEVGLFD